MPLVDYICVVYSDCVTQEIDHEQYVIIIGQISIACLILVGLEGFNIELYCVCVCVCNCT